jgi:glucokinase
LANTVLAVDIGGTKIAAGVIDESGDMIATTIRPTPTDSAEATWAAVHDAIREVLDGRDVAGVGVGCAGPVDTTAGTVSPINVPCWQEYPLRDRLRAALPGLPIELASDGVCIALGEHWRGAGRGSEFLVGLVVSTGVGGGLVLNGRPYGGRTGNAGHIGHIVVEDDGWPCACGGRGCVETVAGGPYLVRRARERGWRAPHEATAVQLAAAAQAGDKVAIDAFERAGYAVGLAIAATAALFDLDLAVIGGGVAQAGDLLFEPVRAAVRDYAKLSYIDNLRVVPAELGGSAGLIGAAALALRS